MELASIIELLENIKIGNVDLAVLRDSSRARSRVPSWRNQEKTSCLIRYRFHEYATDGMLIEITDGLLSR